MKHPAVLKGLSLRARGAKVVVSPGVCVVDGRNVTVREQSVLPVEPAPIVRVTGEALKLPATKPGSYCNGKKLKGPDAHDVNALDSYVRGTLVIRRKRGGRKLIKGHDYLLSAGHAMVGLGPSASVTPRDTVYASYTYSLMRLDAIEVGATGEVSLRQGEPHVASPLPPRPPKGRLQIANVFRPYRSKRVLDEHLFPITGSGGNAPTGTTAGRIPKTLAKLQAGGNVTVVCWGDSVTAGGNASRPKFRYVDVFGRGLRERFPKAKISVRNISIGGTHSRQWLYPDRFPCDRPRCDFRRLADAKPDLVSIEFVNDAPLAGREFKAVYEDILGRVRGIGAELIFITPHFTHPKWMEIASMRGGECRPYVRALKKFAETGQLALADASARWEHLWREGIPYLTLLNNSVNHPDDRGHLIFAEELWKCFR